MHVQKKVKKGALTLALLSVAIFSYTGIIEKIGIEKTWIGTIDEKASQYLDRTMKKALVTFAVVRGINGVISVIQDSDVAVSPAGVGITIAVGEILDPVNDIIERFSWVMLASTTSLGIQKIMMTAGKWLGFRILLSVSMVTLLIAVWLPYASKANLKTIGLRILFIAIGVRYCIPFVAIATDRIDVLFLDSTYSRATQSLEQVSKEINEDKNTPQGISSDDNILEKVKGFITNIKYTVNLEEKIQTVKEKISYYIEYIIDLVVIFILQTVIIPLVILWILVRGFKYATGKNIREIFTRQVQKDLRMPISREPT